MGISSGFCEYCNKTIWNIKASEFLDMADEYQLLKRQSASLS